MKQARILGSLVALLTTACIPNDFESTPNPTPQHEIERASQGIQIQIRNRIPSVPAVRGLPTVFHLNAQLCNWDPSTPRDRDRKEDEPLRPGSLSQCYRLNGTIHSGDSETFLVPQADAERIFRASGGNARFLFQSSAQGTAFFQGCSAPVHINADFKTRKILIQVDVTGQYSEWGYQCSVS